MSDSVININESLKKGSNPLNRQAPRWVKVYFVLMLLTGIVTVSAACFIHNRNIIEWLLSLFVVGTYMIALATLCMVVVKKK